MCFLQNEVKYIRNENKELKYRISDLVNDNRNLQDTMADLEAQKAGFLNFLQFNIYTIDVLQSIPGNSFRLSDMRDVTTFTA